MKKKKTDISLSDVFRQTLKDTEVMPSDSVSVSLFKKLRVRQFMSFKPSTFNVWYAGAIVVASAVVAFSLLHDDRTPPDDPIELQEVDSVDNSTLSDVNIFLPEAIVSLEDDGDGDNLLEEEAVAIVEKGEEPAVVSSIVVTERVEAIQLLQDEDLTLPIETDLSNRPLIIEDEVIVKDDEGVATIKSAMPSFEPSVYEGCVPLSVSFVPEGVEMDSVSWSFGDGGFSSEYAPEWLFDEAGIFVVSMQTSSNYSMVKEIVVHPIPLAKFEIPDEPIIPNDNVTFSNYSTGAIEYRWSFGDGTVSELFEPTHSYQKYDHYDVRLLAVSEHGCVDSVVVNDAFRNSKYYIEFPNAFIPNHGGSLYGSYSTAGEMTNEVFHPSSYGVSEYQLRVFSKRGVLLFESTDLNIGWDGYYKGMLCDPGVYVWKVRGRYFSGETFIKMGDVTIIKSEQL